MKGKKIRVNNVTYPSKAKACISLKINPLLVNSRLRQGFSVNDAFSKKRLSKRNPQEGKKVTIKGITYPSISNSIDKLGIKVNKNTVLNRIYRGTPLLEALELRKFKKRSSDTIKFKGKVYNSKSDLAKSYGVNPTTFISKINQGQAKYSISEALGLKKPKFRRQPQTYKVAGVIFKDFKSMCNYFNIRPSTVAYRLDKLKWKLEQALELKKRKGYHKNKFGIIYLITNKINKKKYVGTTLNSLEVRWQGHLENVEKNERMSDGSLGRAIKHYGKKNFLKKIIARCSFLDEMTFLERKFIKKYNTIRPHGYNLTAGGIGYGFLGKKIKINGKKFDSLREVSKIFKISYSKLTYRLNQGYTPEEAVGIKYKKPYFPNTRKFNIKRKKFDSTKELANYFNINYNFLRGRIHRNKSVDLLKVIKEAKNGPIDNSKPLKINGIKYPSIEDAMRKNKKNASKIKRLAMNRKNINIQI